MLRKMGCELPSLDSRIGNYTKFGIIQEKAIARISNAWFNAVSEYENPEE
jgi:hypothetical protein